MLSKLKTLSSKTEGGCLGILDSLAFSGVHTMFLELLPAYGTLGGTAKLVQGQCYKWVYLSTRPLQQHHFKSVFYIGKLSSIA
jgi:hypothetical protein